MLYATPCGGCPCNTCQFNVEAKFDVKRADDKFCYNCEDCVFMIGNSFKSHCRRKEQGECKMYRNGVIKIIKKKG